MAVSKKSPHRKPDASETEFSRLLDEYLKKIRASKKQMIHNMLSLRKAKSGEGSSDGKYFIRVSNGRATPDLEFVLEVAAAIKVLTGKDLTQDEVSLWLGAWLHDYLLKAAERPLGRETGTGKKTELRREAIMSFLHAGNSAVNRWRRAVNVKRGIDTEYPPTLSDKDYILHNCVVIVGASFRDPPTSTEDLFRQNAQVSDLMYLPHLDCGPRPRFLTDNMVIALTEPERKKLLGRKHLLVIGGPIVNVAARYLNNKSIFPFCFDEDKRRFDDIFDTLKQLNSLRSGHAIAKFLLMLKLPRSKVKLGVKPFIGKDVENVSDDVKRFRDAFKLDDDVVYDQILDWLTPSHHFFDPLSCRVVGPSGKNPHLGVISLSKNHWADDPHYVAVVVAGLDEYGTVGAMRSLLYSSFNDRPCGGILNTDLPQEGSEYRMFKDAEFRWVIDSYGVPDLKAELEKVEKENRSGRAPYKAFHGKESYFKQYADFVRSFKG